MLKRAPKREEKNIFKSEKEITAPVKESNNSERFKNNKNTIIFIGIIVLLVIIFTFAKISSNNLPNNNYTNTKDNCPSGDSSPSYYDNICWKEEKTSTKNGYNKQEDITSRCDNSNTPIGWTCQDGDESLICDTNYILTNSSDGTTRCKCKSEDFDFDSCDKNYIKSIKNRDLALKYASEHCTCN